MLSVKIATNCKYEHHNIMSWYKYANTIKHNENDSTDVLMPVSSAGGGERTHDLHWAREEPQQAMRQRDAETEVSLGADIGRCRDQITSGCTF